MPRFLVHVIEAERRHLSKAFEAENMAEATLMAEDEAWGEDAGWIREDDSLACYIDYVEEL